MSPYSLASVDPCVDMRYPYAQHSSYNFHRPFNEESLFKSDCKIKIKRVYNAKRSCESNMETKPRPSRTKQSSPESSRCKLGRKSPKGKRSLSSALERDPSPKHERDRSPSNKKPLSAKQNKAGNHNQIIVHVPKNRNVIVNTAHVELSRPIKHSSFRKELNAKPFDWKNYYRLNAIHSFMHNLESDFPSICTTGTIGQSLEGRDLKILRISNSNANNSAVWIDAGIHAREWIAPATAMFIADSIVKNFSTLPDFVTNKDWYFLPVMNPDGYEYTHTKDRMWRKNKAWHHGKMVGVDLNRNFSYAFGQQGSSDDPLSSFYHGPTAFSEPESCAVRDMLLHSGTQFTVYITLHSYGQVILFPFGCRDELCPSYVRLLEGATVMSRQAISKLAYITPCHALCQAIYNCNGNIYKVGISRDVMYGAAGTSNDWSYKIAGIPYCYLLELSSKQHRFKVPQREIAETGTEVLSSLYALMEFVDNYVPPNIASSILECHNDDVSQEKERKQFINFPSSSRCT